MNGNNEDEVVVDLRELRRLEQIEQYIGYIRPQIEDVRRDDPSLRIMTFSDSEHSDNAVDIDLQLSLANALMRNTNLGTLTLSQVVFRTEESAQAMAKGISESKLTYLCLHWVSAASQVNPVSFWKYLYNGLHQSANNIHTLRIGEMWQMGGILALGEALPRLTSLRQLDLILPVLDEPTAQALAAGLGQSKVESLDIIDRRLCVREGLDSLRVWKIVSEGLRSMRNLQQLRLQDVNLSQAVVLRDTLSLMHSLQRLILQEWVSTGPSAEALAFGIGHSNIQSLAILFPGRVESSPQLWQVLLQGIKISQTIKELKLPQVPVEAVADLGQALSSMKSLRMLAASFALTEMSVQALARGLLQSKLEIIELNNGSIRELPDKLGCIRQILYQGLQSVTTLKEVSIKEIEVTRITGLSILLQSVEKLRVSGSTLNNYDELLRDVLVRSCALTTMELSEFLIGDNNNLMALLAEGLRGNSSITKLVLKAYSNHHDEGVDVEALFDEGIFNHASLRELTMEGCNIRDSQVTLLIANWPTQSPIQKLFLGGNRIEARGAQLLMRAAQHRPALFRLDISNNAIGFEGLRIMGEELVHQQHLTHIDLNECFTWTCHEDPDSELAKAQEFLRRTAGQALLDSVIQNHHLRDVSAVRNNFVPGTENNIRWYTSLNRMGRYLLSAHHGLSPTIWCHVFAQCHDPESLGNSIIFFYLQQQPNLAQPSKFIGASRQA